MTDELAEWERELLAIPPACVCDWFSMGERVMACPLHPDSHLNHHSPKETA